MRLAKFNQITTNICFGIITTIALILSGCGGGGGKTVNAQLSSISILPNSISIAQGQLVRLAAVGKYSDNSMADISTQVTWSAASSVVTVSSIGLVKGGAVSSTTQTTITARLGAVTSNTVIVLVTAGVAPVPTSGVLATARWDHTATLIPASGVSNEMVLVAGGYTGNTASGVIANLDSSELYDTGSKLWTVTGRLNIPRHDHNATRLQNGQVLVTAGETDTSTSLNSTELYDPGNQTWALTGSLHEGRAYHTDTLLADGKVLVTGGTGVNGSLTSSELYDPGTKLWTQTTGSLFTPRYSHTSTLLTAGPNVGKVLVMGGFNQVGLTGTYVTGSEIYDPNAQTWSQSSTPNLITGRFNHTATLLTTGQNAGKVLVIGGEDFTGLATSSVELCDPASVCVLTTSLIKTRQRHSATLLANGKILVMGGVDFANNELASVELYDPTVTPPTTTLMTGSPGTPLGPMTTPRDVFTATLLSNGNVLAVGGLYNNTALITTELH